MGSGVVDLLEAIDHRAAILRQQVAKRGRGVVFGTGRRRRQQRRHDRECARQHLFIPSHRPLDKLEHNRTKTSNGSSHRGVLCRRRTKKGTNYKAERDRTCARLRNKRRGRRRTEHIGRQNRLARRRSNTWTRSRRAGRRARFSSGSAAFQRGVRANAKGALDWLDKPAQEFAPEPLREPQILWQCDHPPPAPLTRDEIAERLRRSVPASRDRLMNLALPAIGLWPPRRADIPAVASRFVGTPPAPGLRMADLRGRADAVCQIDCAELRGLPAAEPLPPHGVLAFFGDHDAVQGGDSLGMSAVYHWPDADRLVAAQPPIEPILIFPACAVAPRPF